VVLGLEGVCMGRSFGRVSVLGIEELKRDEDMTHL
jgi:hypothetical protein